MSLIKRLRSAASNKGGVSGELRSKLGEELAAMFRKVGQRVYAAATEQIKKTVADSLMSNQSVLAAALHQEFGRRGLDSARDAVKNFLDEVIGDTLTDVAEDIYKELPEMTDMIVETAQEAAGDDLGIYGQEDEEDEVEDEMEEDEGMEEEEEEEMEELEEGDAEELAEVADELEKVKSAGLAQAARLAAKGNFEAAAYLETVFQKL